MSNPINPDHYKRLPAEAIEIIEAAIDRAPSNRDALLHGQVLKYILRCWEKNGIEDLRKAKWYLDRLIDSFDESEAEQPAWTPKVGDWVRIRKPSGDKRDSVLWSSFMDEHDKEVVQVKEIKDGAMVHGEWFFPFDWLEPAEQPVIKQSSPTEPPDGWRWLEVGEVIRKGDRYWFRDAWHDRGDEFTGFRYSVDHCPTIRRNRFEVGEKVMHINGIHACEVVECDHEKDQYVIVYNGSEYAYKSKWLAPYIEETK